MLHVIGAGYVGQPGGHAVGKVLVFLNIDRVTEGDAILGVSDGRAVVCISEGLILFRTSHKTNTEAGLLERAIELSFPHWGMFESLSRRALIRAVTRVGRSLETPDAACDAVNDAEVIADTGLHGRFEDIATFNRWNRSSLTVHK